MNTPILVSQRLVSHPEYPEIRETLDVRWGAFLSRCGLLPVPVSLHVPAKDYFSRIKPKGPLIGICRGMQMLAHHFGGRLKKKHGHVGGSHFVDIVRGTRLSEFYNCGQMNSYHCFCLVGAGKKLKIAPQATKDGSIEAVEYPRKALYGLMWHPERYEPFRHCDLAFF